MKLDEKILTFLVIIILILSTFSLGCWLYPIKRGWQHPDRMFIILVDLR